MKSSADEALLKENNAPSTDTLAQMSPESIYAALTTGAMVQQAKNLSNDEKRLVAEFFGGRPLGAADPGDIKNMTNHCAANPQMGNIRRRAFLERLGRRTSRIPAFKPPKPRD